MLAVDLVEAFDRARRKAHRLQHLGVAGVAVRDRAARNGCLPCLGVDAARHDLAEQRQQGQHHGAGQGQAAEPGMEEIDECQVERDPGQVEQCAGPLPSEEAADGVDVAAALHRFSGRESEARHVDGDTMGDRRDLLVEARPDAHQHLRADDVEAALEKIEADRERRERHQCLDTAAGERPVVDLHHVERAGQGQHVDEARHHEEEKGDAAQSVGQPGSIALAGG